MVTFGDKIYQSLLDPLPQAILILRGGSVAFANAAAGELLGVDTSSVVGRSVESVIGPGWNRRSDETYSASGARIMASTILGPDGTTRDVEIETEPFELGMDPLLRVTLRDARTGTPVEPSADERRKRTVESELRAIFRALPDHFMRLDSHGRILEYNAPDGASPFPSPMQFIGRRIHEMFPLEIADTLTDAIETALDSGRLKSLEFSVGQSGATRYFETRIVPYTADRLIAMLRDVTDRKRIEEQTLVARKLESIERLAGGMAHEFNNLRTTIMAHGELAKLELPADSPSTKHIEPILAASERAADLTRKLLAFSRSHVGEVRPVALPDLLKHLIEALRRTLGDDVALRAHLQAEDATVLADPRLLEKAIFNVVLNAREAMSDGGTLTIALRSVSVGPVFASKHFGMRPGSYCGIFLRDTGIGMDAATLRRAFDPFFTTKRPGEGRGLGLPTTHGIVKQLGGYVMALSKPGRGTTLAIYLPHVTSSHFTPTAGNTVTTNQRKSSVLVVEDEVAVRDVVARALRNKGYEVVTSENGRAALDHVTSSSRDYDMLVTDVIMPQMGGRELAERLRRDRPALKVLYMSGYTASALEPSDLAIPGTGFLQKPFSPAALAEHVSKLLLA